MSTRRFPAFPLAALLVLLVPAPAALAQSFDFTFTDSNDGVNATGSFDLAGGVATNATVNVTGGALGTMTLTSVSSAYLVQDHNFPSPTTYQVDDLSGAQFPFDNTVVPYPLNNPDYPGLTDNGLAFVGNFERTAGNGFPIFDTIVNIWGNGGNSYTLAEGSDTVNAALYIGTLTLTPVPEPSTYAAILGAAALGIAVVRRKRMLA